MYRPLLGFTLLIERNYNQGLFTERISLMEVQTYMLCQGLQKRKNGVHDAQTLCVHTLWPLDGIFPIKFSLFQYMCLRERRLGVKQGTATIRILDADNKPVQGNNSIQATAKFTSLSRFFFVYGNLPLNIPEPGDYRVEIKTDEHIVYYDFVVYRKELHDQE